METTFDTDDITGILFEAFSILTNGTTRACKLFIPMSSVVFYGR
jgi:hypothetical protein